MMTINNANNEIYLLRLVVILIRTCLSCEGRNPEKKKLLRKESKDLYYDL